MDGELCDNMLIRLQKIIAQAGVTSRRKAEELILSGSVTVNGRIIRKLGSKADPKKDHIKVKGHLIRTQQPLTYLIFNKPKGVVTTLIDPQGRPTVMDFIDGIKTRVYPVGRLDYDSEGLLFLTNDGQLAQELIHPRYEIPRTYLVKVKGVVSEQNLKKLREGMSFTATRYAPCRVEKIRKTPNHSWLEMTLYEGQKREIRRMMDKINHPVLKLKRTRLATLKLGDLSPGRYRRLTSEEIRSLRVFTLGRRSIPRKKEENIYRTALRKT
jgi:23S rRNA pseudouridine2605 synthase